MKNFDTRVYSVADFVEWNNNGLLTLSPNFQRRAVWSEKAKSFLIDTIIRGKPVPKILISQELKGGRNLRVVVDGQQRLRAVLGFINGDFKISRAHNDEYAGMTYEMRLIRFDAENQRQFSGETAKGKMSKRQLHLLTETIFFYGFRAYEAFLRDIFLLYCFEKRPRSGVKVESFLRPNDFSHAEELIKSSMPFLDWTAPETIISRAALYPRDGGPVRLPYTSNKQMFTDLKAVRNHIAHNSKESLVAYRKVLVRHFAVMPLSLPSPGEFLLLMDPIDPTKYKLLVYLTFLRDVSKALT